MITEAAYIEIWVAGDSMVRWAAHHALEVIKDVQLGLSEWGTRILWKGRSGAYLTESLPQLVQEIESANPKPDMLILHYGTNDLGSVPHHIMQQSLKHNVQALQEMLPDLVILWSNIIPCQFYLVAWLTAKLDKARKKVNRFTEKLLTGPTGGTIHHYIPYNKSKYFFPGDEVHLSQHGNSLLVGDYPGMDGGVAVGRRNCTNGHLAAALRMAEYSQIAH